MASQPSASGIGPEGGPCHDSSEPSASGDGASATPRASSVAARGVGSDGVSACGEAHGVAEQAPCDAQTPRGASPRQVAEHPAPTPESVSRECLGPDIDCVLCHRLLFEPVSLACGHSFCKACLERALRYNSHCPNCRAPVHYDAALPVSICLRSVLESALPAEYAERRRETAAEVSGAADASAGRLPLFVLTAVVFPGGTERYCIFEPRYRLMLQRVMQGSRRFGIVSLRQCDQNSSLTLCRVGCVLEVTKCVRMRDDRYLIDTVGRDRFTILDTEELDGYLVARTIKLVDEPETPDTLEDNDGAADQVNEPANAQDGERAVRSRQLSHVTDVASRQDSMSSLGPNSAGSCDLEAGGSSSQGIAAVSDGTRRDSEDRASNMTGSGGTSLARAHRPIRRTASVAAYARRLIDEVIAGSSMSRWTGPTVANVLRAAGPPPRPEEGATKLGMWLADRLIQDVNQRQSLLEETDPAERLIAISSILEQANNISLSTAGFAGGCAII